MMMEWWKTKNVIFVPKKESICVSKVHGRISEGMENVEMI